MRSNECHHYDKKTKRLWTLLINNENKIEDKWPPWGNIFYFWKFELHIHVSVLLLHLLYRLKVTTTTYVIYILHLYTFKW